MPIAVAELVAGSRPLPADPSSADWGRIDVAGALTVTGGLFVCVYAIAQAPERGWVSVRTVALFAAVVSVVLSVMVLNGLGTAATFPALNMSAVTGVPDRGDQGLAGALLNTSMQIGGAVVPAVVTAVAEAGRRAGGGADPMAGYVPAIVVIVGCVLAGLAATALVRTGASPLVRPGGRRGGRRCRRWSSRGAGASRAGRRGVRRGW